MMQRPTRFQWLVLGPVALLALTTCLLVPRAARAQSQQSPSPEQPYVVEYYYKPRWGYADEFLRLFKKNHYPVLKKLLETGRILRVTAVRPRYHATEEGRWDFRVTIVWKNFAAQQDPAAEQAIIKQLFPDQETFHREEQRRFEILLAHWDVPIRAEDLEP